MPNKKSVDNATLFIFYWFLILCFECNTNKSTNNGIAIAIHIGKIVSLLKMLILNLIASALPVPITQTKIEIIRLNKLEELNLFLEI